MRALRFPSAVDRLQSSEWARLVKLVDQLDPHSTDWGQASTSLIEGFVKRHNTKGGAYSSGSSPRRPYGRFARAHRGNRIRPSVWGSHVPGVGMETSLGHDHSPLRSGDQRTELEARVPSPTAPERALRVPDRRHHGGRPAMATPSRPRRRRTTVRTPSPLTRADAGRPQMVAGTPPEIPGGSGVGPTRCFSLIRFRCRRGCSPPPTRWPAPVAPRGRSGWECWEPTM